MNNHICYICGKRNAKTKDHVPPKCFLPKSNPVGSHRLTLWAHTKCNQEYSKDEEYLRDLLAPPAIDYPQGNHMIEKAKKAWEHPAGKVRLENFLQEAKEVELRSSSGLTIGKALGIPYDYERVRRVGLKIAQGIIYYDTATFIKQSNITCVLISTNQLPSEKEREIAKGNPLWLALTHKSCLHNMFSQSIVVRRAYIGITTKPTIECQCVMWIGLYSQSFIVVAKTKLSQNTRNDFSILISEDTWVKNV
jgi:hypothetical protein